MRLSRRLTDTMLTTGLLAAVTGIAVLALQLTTPKIGTVRYQYEGKPEKAASLPLTVRSEGERLTVRIPVKVGIVHSVRLRAWPDDCIEKIEVNGKGVDLPPDPCMRDQGHVIDFAGALKAGSNDVLFVIRDTGGEGGLNMRVSMGDPIRFLLVVVIVAAVALAGMRLASGGARGKAAAGRKWIVAIVLLGIGLRLALISHPGFGYDMGVNMGWARSAAKFGLGASYSKQVDGNLLPNYPPLSMLAFGAVGKTYQTFVLPALDANLPSLKLMIKTPAIFMDLLLIVFAWWFFRRLVSEQAGTLAAFTVAVHPILLHNSAVWGQTDVLYAATMVFALAAAIFNRWYLAGALTAAALLFKAQAVIVLPVMMLLAFSRRDAWWKAAIGGLLTVIVVLLPFVSGGGLPKIWDSYVHSVGNFKSLTVAADNLWMALYDDNSGKDDTGLLFGLMTYRTVGLTLFVTATLGLLLAFGRSAIRGLKKPRRYGFFPLLLTGMIAWAFFLFNTEMHERYLVAAFPLLLPMLIISTRAAWLYVAATAVYFLNLLHVLQIGDLDRTFVREFPGLNQTVAVLLIVLFFLTIAELLRIQRLLDEEHTHWLRTMLRERWRTMRPRL